MKRKRGRPTSDPKTARLTVRLAAADVGALKRRAAQNGLRITDLARRLLREALGTTLSKTNSRRSK